MIGVSGQSKPHEVLNIMARGMAKVVNQLCHETGEAFVKYVLQPQFRKEIIGQPGPHAHILSLGSFHANDLVMQTESEARRLAALQVYIVAALPFLGKERLTAFLRYSILVFSMLTDGA